MTWRCPPAPPPRRFPRGGRPRPPPRRGPPAEAVAGPAGANATVVAHLDPSGTPVITPFVNDTSAVPAGQARVVVRHTAAAPAVDVRAGGTPVIQGLTNPDEKALTVPAGTVQADVVLAGTGTVAIGPADLSLTEGATTVVYAWGSQDAGFQLAVQTLSGSSSAPAGMPAGSGGQDAHGPPPPPARTPPGRPGAAAPPARPPPAPRA